MKYSLLELKIELDSKKLILEFITLLKLSKGNREFMLLPSYVLEAHTLLVDRLELVFEDPTKDLLCVKLNKELARFSDIGEDFRSHLEYSAVLNDEDIELLIS